MVTRQQTTESRNRVEAQNRHHPRQHPSRTPRRAGRPVGARDTRSTLRDDAEFELVDLADFHLPHLDEPMPAVVGRLRERAHQGVVGQDRHLRRLRLRDPRVQPLAPRARSRTRSTSCTASGTTRPPRSSATAPPRRPARGRAPAPRAERAADRRTCASNVAFSLVHRLRELHDAEARRPARAAARRACSTSSSSWGTALQGVREAEARRRGVIRRECARNRTRAADHAPAVRTTAGRRRAAREYPR